MRHVHARAAPLVLALGLAAAAQAQPLRIVTVGAPAVNCVFSPTCTVTVTDLTDPLFGSGFLQTRTYQAAAGSPAAGMWVYEFRVDLTSATLPGGVPRVSGLAIDFGPVVATLDYDGDGRAGDQVFVVTSGGLGSVGPVAAMQTGRVVTFRFNPPVHGAGAAAGGQTSYFFGMVSEAAPRPMTARAFTAGGTIGLDARAPERFQRAVRPRPLPLDSLRLRPLLPIAPEDCIGYDPRNLRIVDEGAQGWLLAEGSMRMLMLDSREDAGRALALARRHTRQCFIGRGNTRPDRKAYITQYWTGSSGIAASIPGEDCVSYGPSTVGVFNRGAMGWRMEDGSHAMLLFDDLADANRGLTVARAGSGRLCFIGRGNGRPDRDGYIVEYWP